MMRAVALVLLAAGVRGQVEIAQFESDIPACKGTKCASVACVPPFSFRSGADAGTCCGMCWSDAIKVPEDRSWTKSLTGGVGMNNNADPVTCKGVMCPPLHCVETEQFFDGRCCTKCNTAKEQTAADLARNAGPLR